MNKRSKTAVWLPIVATLLFCVLAILSGRLQKQEAIGNVVSEQMTFPNGTDVSLSAGGAYGMVESEGPGLTLPAGKYRIHWVAENDGDALLHVLCDNGTAIEPSTFVLPAGEGEGDIELTLPESCENVQFKFEFAAGEVLRVGDLRLYLPAYADDEWTLAFFALALSVLWVLYATGRMKPDDACILLAIGIAVLIASGPALKETLNIGHDTEWHLARIENLASGLREGQFPVRLGGDSYNYAFRDRTTQGVIDDVASGESELGVVFETSATAAELDAAFDAAGLEFVQLVESAPRVALPASHPLVNASSLTLEQLADYPYIYFDQGKDAPAAFFEEALGDQPRAKSIATTDRASLSELIVALNGYTVTSGILVGISDGAQLRTVALDADVTLRLGYLKEKGAQLDGTAARFVATLEKNLERYARF